MGWTKGHLILDADGSTLDIFLEAPLNFPMHNMAIQEQNMDPCCELCQEMVVYSDVLVCATLLLRGPDAVRISRMR